MGFLLIRPSSTSHLSWRRASLCLSLSTLQFFEVDLLPFLDYLCTFHLCHLHTHSYVVFLHCCLLGSFLCRHCHVLVFEVYGWITDILASGFFVENRVDSAWYSGERAFAELFHGRCIAHLDYSLARS